jgi:hypothetical protein
MTTYSDLVRVDSSLTEIIGVRILKKESTQYRIIHSFVDDDWKESARLVVPMYKNVSMFAFHTLHRFLPWADVPEEQKGNTFWLHNPYFYMTYLS